MILSDVQSFYTEKMDPKGDRTIGPEVEYPMVRKADLGSVDTDDLKVIFGEFGNRGWSIVPDGQTRFPVLAFKGEGDEKFVVTTDFGAGTLEINLPPRTDLHRIEKDFSSVLGEVSGILMEKGFLLLGYGIQPVSPPSVDLVAKKGRYQTLANRFYTREKIEWLNGDESTDVLYHTINSASQVHVRVRDSEEAVKAVNLLNKASPLFSALLGNSPIWIGGNGDRDKDVRQRFWNWVVNIEQDQWRKGIPKRTFTSFDDYVDTVLRFEPVMTARIRAHEVAGYLEIVGAKSLRECLERGNMQVVDPGTFNKRSFDTDGDFEGALREGNNLQTIHAEGIDVHAHDSFVWYDARVKGEYGTVEVRCASQQPPEDQLVVAALSTGLIENLDGLGALLGGFSMAEARAAQEDCIKHGLHGSYEDASAVSLAKKMVEVAYEGLRRRAKDEESYLEPLRERVKDKKNPADIVLKAYESHGMAGVIDFVEIKQND